LVGQELHDRSRRPHRFGNSWNVEWREMVVQLRRTHGVGARKLRWYLRQKRPGRPLPSVRTMHRWLKAAAQVERRRWRAPAGPAVTVPAHVAPKRCNWVWSIDFKGRFHAGDGTPVDALTIRDMYSRFMLGIVPVSPMSAARVRQGMIPIFRRYGLPRAIRVDRGAPFFGPGPHGWTRLSTWWIRLGIRVQFTRRNKSQDNGAHEQMHRILKADTATPAAATLAAQRARFASWTKRYNEQRPHAAHGEMPPCTRYRPSPRRYPACLPELVYPRSWSTLTVDPYGCVYWQQSKRTVGLAFARQTIGLRRIATGTAVYLGSHLLGTLRPDEPGLRPCASSRRGG
jgi:putative transposase